MKLRITIIVLLTFTSCGVDSQDTTNYFPIKRHNEWSFEGYYKTTQNTRPIKYLGKWHWKIVGKESNTYTVEHIFEGVKIVSNGNSLDTLDYKLPQSYFLITLKEHGWIRIHNSFLNFGSDYIEVKNLFPDYYEETIKLKTKDGNIVPNLMDIEISLKRNLGIFEWNAVGNYGNEWSFKLIDYYLR